jgi:hypothetical protein
MTKESFRKDIRRAFDDISGSPSPALGDKVRSRLDEPVEQRAPVWAAGLAAVLIAAIVVGVLVVVHPFNRNQVSLAGPSPTPAASASPIPTPSPTPPYDCTAQTRIAGPAAPPLAYVTAVRVGDHRDLGYDQITIEFKDTVHGTITIDVQPSSTFIQDGSGAEVTLAGKYGLRIQITGADEHTDFSGSTDLKNPSFLQLKEARLLGDFEGHVTWGLGLASPACYRVEMLDNPTRLVVYLQIK